MIKENIKTGIWDIRLDTYWKQYTGFETRLKSYPDAVTKQTEVQVIRVMSAGMVDKFEKAHAADSLFKQNEELERAAKTAVSLNKMMDKHNFGSLCYYYDGTPGNEYDIIITSVIVGSSLLTSRHIPFAGEAEVKNVQAMKILDLFGAGGSFTEFYLMDFNEEVPLMGHEGPVHIAFKIHNLGALLNIDMVKIGGTVYRQNLLTG